MTSRKNSLFYLSWFFARRCFIPNSNNFWIKKKTDKDKSKSLRFTTEEKGKKTQGEVIEVVERNKTDFVGVIDIQT